MRTFAIVALFALVAVAVAAPVETEEKKDLEASPSLLYGGGLGGIGLGYGGLGLGYGRGLGYGGLGYGGLGGFGGYGGYGLGYGGIIG